MGDYTEFSECCYCGCIELDSEMYRHSVNGVIFAVCESCEQGWDDLAV
ncbi:MAG: hypothetical protein AAF975_02025 [Spirochaetota bacterium]